MNRRSFLSRFVGCIAAAAIAIRLEPAKPIQPHTPGGVLYYLEQWELGDTRRRIFYEYPNGSAPLTGLLKLCDDYDKAYLFGKSL